MSLNTDYIQNDKASGTMKMRSEAIDFVPNSYVDELRQEST